MNAASKANDNVVEYEHKCALLAPTGVRNRHVIARLAQVNEILTKIQGITGWGPVRVTPSFDILLGGRPSSLPNSESVKSSAQWSVQVAFSILQNAKWVILDRCDVLRDDAWDGLMKLAEYWSGKNPANYMLLCSTSPP